MVTIEIVINFTYVVQVFALHPAGVHCPTWAMLLIFCFVCFFVTLQRRRDVRLRDTYFEPILCHGLWVNFDAVLGFSRRDCHFRRSRNGPFSSPCGATIFAKVRPKLLKLQNLQKSLCAPLHIDSREINSTTVL